MHRAARRGDIGAETHVVFHVAGVGMFVVIELAFEFIEQFARRFAERVDQHVEAAAMGHAQHHILDAIAAGAADHHVEHRDQCVAAFQRETLLADVLGVQVALEAFGRGQTFQNAALVLIAAFEIAAGVFKAFIHPTTLFDVGDMHEFGTNAAGVRRFEQADEVAQFHLRLTTHTAAGQGCVEVGIR